ncbi:MAG: helix-turn-helix transcriptional regulator [Promicromonosporaceae bacterium]|nr:helix-turn-helix transcriptional regulator [Promicromonosporaceae bacterium]
MDRQQHISEFLRTRRERLTPKQAGLTRASGRRRTAGLRREEVALLAGISVHYYAKMERGNLDGVSRQVLESLITALQLAGDEAHHLRALAAPQAEAITPTAIGSLRPSLQRLLECITEIPAWFLDDQLTWHGGNALANVIHRNFLDNTMNKRNIARYVLTDPNAKKHYLDWSKVADVNAAFLRGSLAKYPHDRKLADLVAELSAASEEFRERWIRHDVCSHRVGRLRWWLVEVGELNVGLENFPVAAEPGLTLHTATPEPGSPTEERLRQLAARLS